ncbi:MAG TPA: metal ABC transporter permease [Solirubrobacteraceae bacterium]|nr:metal ABC transporter permease [Solirubrobacteraceae bacterium]
MAGVLHTLVEPGFFSDSAVQLALVVGGVVALVAAAVGVFTVLRGQAFAGDALGHMGAAGGSSAYLIGLAPLWGFVAVALAAAGLMEMVGIQRARGRDLATGIVLGAGLGLAALFLYLDTTHSGTAGATGTILVGSIFTLDPAILPAALALGAIALIIVIALFRPLLLSSISPELAVARGIPVRAVGILYLIAMAVAVALCAVTIGAILSTALLIGPGAAALALTNRPGRAVALAGVIGLAATWLGVLLAYDSYYWPPLHHGWPVSFFVVALVLIAYLGARAGGRRRVGG